MTRYRNKLKPIKTHYNFNRAQKKKKKNWKQDALLYFMAILPFPAVIVVMNVLEAFEHLD